MLSIRSIALTLALTVAVYGAPKKKLNGTYSATAYTVEGTTDSGLKTRQGIVAADPDILPFGSRIKISGCGKYSGVYLVADSGRKIQGREVDIYIRNDAEAKAFGKQSVQVKVLKIGTGERLAR